jgi:hypothetical protein
MDAFTKALISGSPNAVSTPLPKPPMKPGPSEADAVSSVSGAIQHFDTFDVIMRMSSVSLPYIVAVVA